MRVPDFVYIGPHKTGSTWLFHNFQHHPEIFVPFIKYTNYFNRFPERPLSWYLGHFTEATSSHLVVGEFGISYIEQKDAVERLYDINPNMKFIYFFRDMIDQKISEMFHLRRGKNTSPHDIMNVLKKRMENGDRPSAHIERWIAKFGREQFLFEKFEKIRTEPEALLTDVYDFLGVKAVPPVPLTSIEENRRLAPRNVQFGRFARHVADRLREFGMYETLAKLKHSERVRRVIFRDLPSDESASLIAELRQSYGAAFAEEQQRVAAITGLAQGER